MTNGTERVGIDCDERYPDYFLREPDGRFTPAADVDSDTLARWREVLSAYEDVQAEMGEVFERAQAEMKRSQEIAKAEQEAAKAQERLAALRGEA